MKYVHSRIKKLIDFLQNVHYNEYEKIVPLSKMFKNLLQRRSEKYTRCTSVYKKSNIYARSYENRIEIRGRTSFGKVNAN